LLITDNKLVGWDSAQKLSFPPCLSLAFLCPRLILNSEIYLPLQAKTTTNKQTNKQQKNTLAG
jgi:hypothetical protein